MFGGRFDRATRFQCSYLVYRQFRTLNFAKRYQQTRGWQYRAYSAGSTPVGAPNPYAIEHLQSVGIDTAFARSKSWKEFTVEGSTSIDIVITVCDSAASEVCPIFPGRALMAHWGLPDPAGIEDPMQSD